LGWKTRKIKVHFEDSDKVDISLKAPAGTTSPLQGRLSLVVIERKPRRGTDYRSKAGGDGKFLTSEPRSRRDLREHRDGRVRGEVQETRQIRF